MEIEQINQYIKSQETDLAELKRLYGNIRKDSASRKTQKYIDEKRARLTEIFERTSAVHDKLKEQEILSSSRYIKDEFFNVIKKVYKEAIYYLQKCEESNKVSGDIIDIEDGAGQSVNVGQVSSRMRGQMMRISRMRKLLNDTQQALAENKLKRTLSDLLNKLWQLWPSLEEENIMIWREEKDFEHSYFTENIYEELTHDYDTITAKMVELIEDNGKEEDDSKKKKSVNLPKITIPTFSGNYESWVSFYDLFSKIIHDDSTLSDTEKMQYLKSHVRGDAAKLISHLPVCEANYVTAWELLIVRYGNERLIMNKYVDNIINLTKITKGTAENLRNLHDTLNENLQALKNQKVNVEAWDPFLTRFVSRVWDTETDERYEHQLQDSEKCQPFSGMMAFLRTRFKCLLATAEKAQYKPIVSGSNVKRFVCWYCESNEHVVYQCAKFKGVSVQERIKAVLKKYMCQRCLMHSRHQECRSTLNCIHCGRGNHHSTLHVHAQTNQGWQKQPIVGKYGRPGGAKSNADRIVTYSNKPPARVQANIATTTKGSPIRTTLLATALVKVTAIDGVHHMLRVLLDQGSEASFCTEHVAQLLAFPRRKIKAEVVGIADGTPKVSKYSIAVELEPRVANGYKLSVELLVLPKLTNALPEKSMPQLESSCLMNQVIADPTYNQRGPIDIIVGVGEYSSLLRKGLLRLEGGIIAQNTQFGWILSGVYSGLASRSKKIVSMVAHATEMQQLNKFWEMEEICNENRLSNDDKECENYYKKTTHRGVDGTYTVRIPFKIQNAEYGDTRKKAAARLMQLERRFAKDEGLKAKYKEFLYEYLKMGHMKKVPRSKYGMGKFYIPHQPVIREERLTTKLRVVFDASSKSSGSKSLNDNMMVGPRLQQDVSEILLRWRKHKIVFMSDIEKMYRFVKIDKRDHVYQRILWRDSPKQPIDEYELTTVTYGTASAPYLAIRTLRQLAMDEKDNFPEASKVAMRDFFVDDVLTGGSCLETTKKLQEELIKMMSTAGFNLKKWSSNYAELLDNIPVGDKEDKTLKIPLDESRKSLGVLWSPKRDEFYFQVAIDKNDKPTKRYILSEVAKLFDPLGWLAPIIISMKLIIQELWVNGSEWDELVGENIKNKWLEIQDQLNLIESISVPRWCHVMPESEVEFHGFCDASEKAYGAVIYCRVWNKEHTRNEVTLLQAKSKVAPIKQRTTLPKLELCAALLLAQLMERVVATMEISKVATYCWTDSMIALGWIKGEAERWKTFVANRVVEIQRRVPQASWNHVGTTDNPADIVSRGIAPSKLKECKLWWNGPEWLKKGVTPKTKTIPEICEEIKKSYTCTVAAVKTGKQSIEWERYSSFQKLARVMAYCYRFIKRSSNRGSVINSIEIEHATRRVLSLVQQEALSEEYKNLKKGHAMKKGNKLACLDPFIDKDGLIRVGGRLRNADLPYDQKHPIVLPYEHHVTTLIIHDAHHKTLHGGNTMTLAYIRQKCWIIGGKRKVKNYIRRCVKCVRYKASATGQKMGDLPRERVTRSFPFSHTGIDYAGPIQVRAMKGRGHKSYKGYVAVFICLATKAIHLELVGDLSTESFIAALQRFVARRGPVSHIYSDNATNFVGAANVLYKELLQMAQTNDVQSAVANIGIQWHFNPPSAPHFGGIWEAGVKSMKHHLRRVIGEQTLTYEELITFLYQAEACLNSRPLCAQSDDINDDVVLTPSHFLIGREAIGIPDPFASMSTDHVSKWKQIQKMKKDFWRSWNKDYLHQLQQRYKWKSEEENLSVGTLVLVKDDNHGPSKWPIARIVETHKGSDGLIRVVTLRKPSGVIQKRPIHTLIPLPVEVERENEEPTERVLANSVRIKNVRNRKERRTSIGCGRWMFYLFIIMHIILSCTSAATYTVKQLEPGLYVEQLGSASVDRGTFRIETTFDRERLNEDLYNIKNVTERFGELCENAEVIIQETHCKQFHNHLLEQESKFARTHEYLSDIYQTSRKKRGILGQLLTSVFGVNDEAYRDIDTLQQNQQKLIEAANHQTKFMLSTISQVNNTEEQVRQKLESFQTKLNTIIGYMQDNNNWYSKIDNNMVNIQVIQTYQLADNYIEEVSSNYNGLLEIYLSRATVYSVLPPKNVTTIIERANKKLPSNVRIVQQQLLETRIAENSTHIQVYAYFPIQDITKYTLMHVTAIPQKNSDSSFSTLEVEKAYIGVDYNNERYFDMKYEEFTNCLQRFSHYICFPGAVKTMQYSENCIVDQLFKNKTKSTCGTVAFDNISKGILWKQVYMKNTWLFVVKDSTTTSIICDGEREEIELRDVGIIQISDNCIIKTPSNILVAKRAVSVQTMASYYRKVSIEIKSSLAPSNKMLNITKEEIISSSQDIYQHLINKEQTMQKELDHTVWKQISTHTYVTSVVSSIIIIIIVVALIIYVPKTLDRFSESFQLKKQPKRVKEQQPSQQDPEMVRPQPAKPPRRHQQQQRSQHTAACSSKDGIELYDVQPWWPQNV